MPTMSGRHYCLSKELQAQGHEVIYFMWQLPFGMSLRQLIKHAFTSLVPKTYMHEAFVVHKAIRLPFFWPVINGWIFKSQLRRLYKELGADVILTESYTNETEVPRELPYIYDLADDYAGPAEVYGTALYKFAFKLLDVRGTMRRQCQHAQSVTAVSSTLYDYAKKLNDNTSLVQNGVERELIEHTLPEKRNVKRHSIVYATGFGQWSRAIETLETVTKLRKEFPDITLTLVGSGTEVQKIKQYIDEHDAHDYMRYIDYIYNRQELFTLLSSHAIGLNISDKNAWRDASHPMKVMDYSALGMKVVSTNLTEVKKLGYDNIFLFSDTNKRQGLQSVLRRALKDRRRSYKKVSEQVLQNFDWSVIVRPIINTCDQIVHEKAVSKQVTKNRIIHVTYAYPPAVGGLEQVAQQLATEQSEAGASVSVITSNKGWDETQETKDTITVTRLKSFVIANTTIIPGLFRQLLRLKSEDTVHIHIAQAFTPEIVWLASKIRGFRYVAHVHLDVPPSGWAGFLLRIYKPLVLGKVLRDAHGVAVFTAEQKQILSKRYHIETTRVHVIPNGVADEFFINKRRSMHKKPRLLFVGRLSYQKNLTQLLDALDGISDQFTTTLVGDGELRADLEAHAKKLNLKNITFAGFASGATLRAYYEQADIFVLPSEREGMPLVLLEAMAAGLPIVATRVTGNKDVVKHNKNGLLVPYGNASALRAALLKLGASKSLYRSMSRTAAAMALAFTWTAVRERFASVYPQQIAKTDIIKPATNNHRTVGLPVAIIPLLIFAVAAYAIPNAIGSTLTLLFFLTAPGYLLLRRIASGFGGWWERAGLSVVLSLLVIMVGGLFLNTLHYIGLDRPLTTINTFITLSLVTLFLIWLNRKERIVVKLPKLVYPSTLYLIVATLVTSLPVLAIGGAIRLNNGASNILTMTMFAMAGVLVMLLISRKELKPLYPYALYMIALGVLLSTSLRGWSVTGHDIVHEYQVFHTVASDNLWKVVTEHKNPYSACLSITMLPTILANISHVTDIYIFKIVFQILFASIATLIYAISLKLTNRRRLSMIAALIFISFPPFLNDMPFLNRQESALLFFAAAILAALCVNPLKKTERILVPLLLLGIVLSHYSTSYVTLGLLSLSWVVYRVIGIGLRQKELRPLFSARLIIGFIFVTFIWNTAITQTSPGLTQTIEKVAKTLQEGKFSQADGVQYSLLSFGSHDPQEKLDEYVNNPDKKVQYYASADIDRTVLGNAISKFVPIEAVNKIVRGMSAKLLQALLIAGVIIIFIRYKKTKSVSDMHILSFTTAGLVLLVMMVLLPVLSEKYSVTRMFQQILLFGAIPIAIAATELFKFIKLKRPIFFTAILFVFMFLHLSGFLPQITGGYPPQMALNNAGTYYDIYYQNDGERTGAAWVSSHYSNVYLDTDIYGLMRFPNYPFQAPTYTNPLLSDKSPAFLFQDSTTKNKGVYAGFISGDVLQYSYDDHKESRSLLYTNQNSAFYGPSINE